MPSSTPTPSRLPLASSPADPWPDPALSPPRKVLCVYPRHTNGYPAFAHSFRFFPKTKSLSPPLGLLLVAGTLPAHWSVRFVDEDIRPALDADFLWSDLVLTSGTHAQRLLLADVADRAHRHGKVIALGGPAVSASPEDYPMFDLLHVGEMGDATRALVAALAESIDRPAAQRVFRTTDRLALDDFPLPAYHLVDPHHYLMLNLQWSSGCPFTCEFCDIPALYGKAPRIKSNARVLEELDSILAQGPLGAVFFVDDNLIGNKKAFRQLLPDLIAWQKEHGHPLQLVGECALNVAQEPDILAMMREANFVEVYVGLETPEVDALVAMSKRQNLRKPPIDSVRAIQDGGIAVSVGLIVGLDTDTATTADSIVEFVEAAEIPHVVVNMLYALPHSPLWDRLEAEGRLIPREFVTDSNIVFSEPRERVMARWRSLVERLYEPGVVIGRYRRSFARVLPQRLPLPPRRPTLAQVFLGLYALAATAYFVLLRSRYRRAFAPFGLDLLRGGHVDSLISAVSVSYHMIAYRDGVLAKGAQPCIHTAATPSAQSSTGPSTGGTSADDITFAHVG